MNWLRKLWQDFGDGPEWRVISATYLLGAGAAGFGGYFAEPRWLSFFDAVLAGWCLHGAIATRMIKQYRDLFEEMRSQLAQVHELNKALLEDKVRLHLVGLTEESGDSGPAKTIN